MRSGCGLRSELFDEACGSVADLRTFTLPVRQAIGLIAERFLTFRRLRVVETDALDKAAIARALGIRDHQIKKRTLFCAAPCQPDNNHGKSDPENAERA